MKPSFDTIQRKTAPVFVLGSPRSGTTLLYDMLLSAGGFAVYLAESNVFNLLTPRFGDLSRRRNRENLMHTWLQTKLFKASGLQAAHITRRVLEECRSAGDFLRLVMSEIAAAQGMQRWAENSPEGMLYLPLLKRLIPDALVVHIIRDGRDVAVSLRKLRYIRPFSRGERPSPEFASLYWEWMVQRGRQHGKELGPDYLEVHFEDLISSPQDTLSRVGRFIDHELDYERIRRVAYGSLTKPNTSFRAESPAAGFSPVGRWKNALSPAQLCRVEELVGNTLQECGYSLATADAGTHNHVALAAKRWIYRRYFEAKLWYKNDPVLRTLRPGLTAAEIDAIVLADDHPAQIKNLASPEI